MFETQKPPSVKEIRERREAERRKAAFAPVAFAMLLRGTAKREARKAAR